MGINELIDEHIKVIKYVKENLNSEINKFIEKCEKCIEDNNTIFFMGNGGSAADSQHLAAEFIGRFKKERKSIPAIALTTDTSILTAIGNDYGYDEVFRRQVDGLVKNGDLVIAISTSGNSKNIILAAELAKQKGAYVIGLLGKDGGKLKNICDTSIVIDTNDTARIQEAHIMIGHIVCEAVE